MNEPIAFVPNINDSIMDELRTTEGMLFRDENTKKLFLDTKELMIESIYSLNRNYENDLYNNILDKYAYWEQYVEAEELDRMRLKFSDIEKRLLSVVITYAKYLYNADDVINIKKPKIETYLKGMFTRFAKNPHVRNKKFFDMDVMKQDFVIRDIFRQALSNDCIHVVYKQEIRVVEEEEKFVAEEVYPEDSISMIDQKQEQKQEETEKIDEDKLDKVSTFSKSTLKSKVPTVVKNEIRKIHIENTDNEDLN